MDLDDVRILETIARTRIALRVSMGESACRISALPRTIDLHVLPAVSSSLLLHDLGMPSLRYQSDIVTESAHQQSHGRMRSQWFGYVQHNNFLELETQYRFWRQQRPWSGAKVTFFLVCFDTISSQLSTHCGFRTDISASCYAYYIRLVSARLQLRSESRVIEWTVVCLFSQFSSSPMTRSKSTYHAVSMQADLD